MLGWLADLFRLYGGLLYWNLRKTWFRLRRGRTACPCQSPSDSGRAFETGCEACVQWSRPARFRRVCPLLVETQDGLRCSADTPDVRPFWGRAAAWYGGTFLAGYGVVVLAVFIFLRSVGYPVSIFEVGLPPLWHRLDHARAWYFFEQSKRAFAAGRSAEGMLYLANAYEFDPGNYLIGLTLAKNYQVGQPAQSDRIFEQLMRNHPDRRDPTAWDWHRALLARGNFPRIVTLARDELLVDPAHGHAWMRALLFATKQTGDVTTLRELALNQAALPWRRLLSTELLIRSGNTRDAHALLVQPWPEPAPPPYTLVYRINSLIALRDPLAALDLLEQSRTQLQDDEAYVTLRLDALAAAGAKNPLRATTDVLLNQRANLASIKIVCAQLIRHPDRETFARVADKVDRDRLPLDAEAAGIWFSLLCTAGVVGDEPRLAMLTERLKGASERPFLALVGVQAFFLGKTNERQVTSILPILPLPIEVVYALLERYPPVPPATVTLPAPTKN